ncbi:MAG TPA: hypothetical protein ENH62_12645 [Marinobacter sp.]|uniref:Uncharacterized protein n=1 Tax=marine sediment metagenome TaxID=412755 RepID=A0A0F9R7H1_9ZZZZ|nr:hypothetical protein [Marinobacter sp.]
MTKRNMSVAISAGPIWDFMPNLNYGAKLSDFIDWLNKMTEEIPAEYRGTAEIEITSEGGWEGEHHVEIIIRYTRPKTAQEIRDHEAIEARTAKQEENHERAIYDRLHRRFG